MSLRLFDQRLPSGITLSCRAVGAVDAPRRIVFLHGFPEAAFVWDGLMHALSPRAHCVAPNMRGYERSSAPASVHAYRAKHLVDDIVGLIDQLGAPLDLLVAHDWGGGVAWNLAALRPTLLRRLVIINSPHPALFQRDLAGNPAQIQASAYMNLLRSPRAETIMGENDFARMAKLVAGMGQEVVWLTPELKARYLECWRRGITGGLNYYRASPLYPVNETEPGAAAVSIPRELVTVKVPTLVIWGMRDEALLPRLLDGLKDYVGDLRIARIEAGSHWVVHEQPQQVNALIRGFLGPAPD